MLKVVRAKLHGIRVTDADLNYHGSITLDPEHCEMAGIYPMEFVDVWNKSNGARITTYVITGKPRSRSCVLNGAASRTCQVGDELIVCASEYCETGRLYDLKPRILTFLPDNHVDQVLQYDVHKSDKRAYDFRIIDADKNTLEDCHTYANVDVYAIQEELKELGWRDDQIDEFCDAHFNL